MRSQVATQTRYADSVVASAAQLQGRRRRSRCGSSKRQREHHQVVAGQRLAAQQQAEQPRARRGDAEPGRQPLGPAVRPFDLDLGERKQQRVAEQEQDANDQIDGRGSAIISVEPGPALAFHGVPSMSHRGPDAHAAGVTCPGAAGSRAAERLQQREQGGRAVDLTPFVHEQLAALRATRDRQADAPHRPGDDLGPVLPPVASGSSSAASACWSWSICAGVSRRRKFVGARGRWSPR